MKESRSEKRLFFYLIVLTAVCMTLHTIIALIPLFFFMFIIHFVLFMTGGTSISRCVPARMTGGTITVGPFMINWESVIKRRIAEISRVGVAVAAGPWIMVWRRRMAGGAILSANR